MFSHHWNEEGSTGGKETSKHRLCQCEKRSPCGNIAGSGKGKVAGLLQQQELAEITEGAPADDQFKIGRRVLFFSKEAISKISVNFCSKINSGFCENHLCGQPGQDLVCSSNSHYAWKICLICFNSNRQKVKHLTEATTSGWQTGPGSCSYLPAGLGFPDCISHSLAKYMWTEMLLLLLNCEV